MDWRRMKQQAKRKKGHDKGDKEKVRRHITGITSRIERIWTRERNTKNVLGNRLIVGSGDFL